MASAFFGLPLVVKAQQLQRPRPPRGAHPAARVDALHGPDEVAIHRLAGVGERPAERLDQGQTKRGGGERAGRRQRRHGAQAEGGAQRRAAVENHSHAKQSSNEELAKRYPINSAWRNMDKGYQDV